MFRVLPPSARTPTPRPAVDKDVIGFGNVLVKPEPGPNPSVVLHVQHAMLSERLTTEHLRRLKSIVDALLEPLSDG